MCGWFALGWVNHCNILIAKVFPNLFKKIVLEEFYCFVTFKQASKIMSEGTFSTFRCSIYLLHLIILLNQQANVL